MPSSQMSNILYLSWGLGPRMWLWILVYLSQGLDHTPRGVYWRQRTAQSPRPPVHQERILPVRIVAPPAAHVLKAQPLIERNRRHVASSDLQLRGAHLASPAGLWGSVQGFKPRAVQSSQLWNWRAQSRAANQHVAAARHAHSCSIVAAGCALI